MDLDKQANLINVLQQVCQQLQKNNNNTANATSPSSSATTSAELNLRHNNVNIPNLLLNQNAASTASPSSIWRPFDNSSSNNKLLNSPIQNGVNDSFINSILNQNNPIDFQNNLQQYTNLLHQNNNNANNNNFRCFQPNIPNPQVLLHQNNILQQNLQNAMLQNQTLLKNQNLQRLQHNSNNSPHQHKIQLHSPHARVAPYSTTTRNSKITTGSRNPNQNALLLNVLQQLKNNQNNILQNSPPNRPFQNQSINPNSVLPNPPQNKNSPVGITASVLSNNNVQPTKPTSSPFSAFTKPPTKINNNLPLLSNASTPPTMVELPISPKLEKDFGSDHLPSFFNQNNNAGIGQEVMDFADVSSQLQHSANILSAQSKLVKPGGEKVSKYV